MSSSGCGARQTLLKIWEERVASYSESYLLSDELENKEYSAANLDAASRALAVLLAQRNIKNRSAAVGVCLSPGAAEAVVLLAVLRCGVPWVPLPSTSAAAAESLGWLGDRVGVLVCDTSSASNFESIASGRGVLILNRDGYVSNIKPESESDRPAKRCRQSFELNEDGASSGKFFGDDILYVMRTSGSTGGDLKFVRGRALSTLNRLQWQWRSMPFVSSSSTKGLKSHSVSVVCRRSPLVFVDSIAEILGTLLGGAVLFVPASSVESDPRTFVAACQRGHVSRITLVPSLLELVLNSLPRLSCNSKGKENGNGSTNAGLLPNILPRLTEWIVSGETVAKSLVENFLVAAGGAPSATAEKKCFEPSVVSGRISLINLYGSTEIAADVTACVLVGPPLSSQSKSKFRDGGLLTCADARRGSGIPVGFPIDNVEMDIVRFDGDGREVEQPELNSSSAESVHTRGNQGEVVVRGVMVADGYCHETASKCGDKTHSRFGNLSKIAYNGLQQNPWFRTGDLGFQCRDCGNLHLVGRVDNQVKIRGVRLSLEEAEDALREVMSGLGLSNMLAVVMHEVTLKAPRNSTRRLVAFVVDSSSDTGASSTVSVISKAAARLLPGHFVPSAIVVIDALPRNKSGKVDRRALVASLDKAGEIVDEEDTASLNLEQWLVTTLRMLLKNDCSTERYLSSSFREVGGDSLMAIELAWLCGEEVSRRRAVNNLTTDVEVAGIPTAAKFLSISLLELLQQLEVAVTREPSSAFIESGSSLPLDEPHNSFEQKDTGCAKVIVPELCDPSAGVLSSWLTRAGLGSCGKNLSLDLAPVDHGPLKAELALRWRLNLGRCVDASALVVKAGGSDAPLRAYIGGKLRLQYHAILRRHS